MSYDLGIFSTNATLSNTVAARIYNELCEEDVASITPNPAVDALYAELTAKHPEIDDVPDEEVDNTDLCPWSVAIERSPGHLLISCVGSKADYVRAFLSTLAEKHGVALYDPQEEQLLVPVIAASPATKPWWKFW